MTRLRGLFAAISPGGLIIPVVLGALLITQSMTGMTQEFDQARCSLEDWTAAIEAFEGGAADYQGRCVSIGIGIPGEIPDDMRQQVVQAQADYEAAAERLADDPWKRAANSVGGAAMVFFALFVGAMAAGSPMGSAIAAWALSNGWNRRSWARATLTTTSLATLGAYLLALVIATVFIYTKITGVGLDIGFPAPSVAALTPIPGLLYFGMVGVVVGLAMGRGEIAGMTAVVVAIADFMGSARFELSPFFPTTWHQTALGATPSTITVPVAVTLAGAAAVVLAALAYWYVTKRRDVPDR